MDMFRTLHGQWKLAISCILDEPDATVNVNEHLALQAFARRSALRARNGLCIAAHNHVPTPASHRRLPPREVQPRAVHRVVRIAVPGHGLPATSSADAR